MKSMVEEMYRHFRKHKDEDSSGSKQDKEEDEFHSQDHPKGKGKEESFPTPLSSPVHNKKASLIKLDVKFDFPIYDGELNAEKLDNWIRQIDVYCRVQNVDSDRSKIQLASLRLGGTALVWWEGRTKADVKKHGKTISVWNDFIFAIRKQLYPLAYMQQAMMSWQSLQQLKGKSVQGYAQEFRKRALMLGISLDSPETLLKYIGGLHNYMRHIILMFNPTSIDEWGGKQQKSFDTLKDKISTTPVLALPDLQRPFEIQTDASDYAMGAVLTQHGKPICYHSETFNPAMVNYPTYDKELYVLVQSVKKWKHYLMGKETVIHTDHQPLQYLHSQTKLQKSRHYRWMGFLQ
eukprot:PITA_05189